MGPAKLAPLGSALLGLGLALLGSALLSDWCFLVFLCIPAYVAYKAARWVLNWVFTPTQEELEAEFMRANQKQRTRKSKKYSRRGM